MFYTQVTGLSLSKADSRSMRFDKLSAAILSFGVDEFV